MKATLEYRQRDHLEYPALTMYDMVADIAGRYPSEPALDFYGVRTSYRSFVKKIEDAASSFSAYGIKQGDAVTICMPNTPQALVCFYALNRIGAVSNMVHPLSARDEITYYLDLSKSRMILTVDLFYEKVSAAIENCGHPVTVIVARMQDELPPHLAALYILKKGRQYLKYPDRSGDLLWKTFVRTGSVPSPKAAFDPDRTTVILYSGGTSGKPKGICLSDLNFNACSMQAREAIGVEFRKGFKMLSCMPLFHGFGLGINLHAVLVHGACCVLMPTFTTKDYAQMLKKKKPNFIAGVPTIFDALLNIPELREADLSFLEGVFCGGDSLSVDLKKKVDAFLKSHGAAIQIREGYGLTECVTASCLTPKFEYREGSIGIPFPDTVYAIVRPGTAEFLPAGSEGEIILKGPTLMLGYLNDHEETSKTLRRLSDGDEWLYTGDLGHMDEEGYVYFHQRIKRVIITNGYNVYPSAIEAAAESLPEVAYCCVIGVKDPRRIQRVRAYVVPAEGVPCSDETKRRILAGLKNKVAAYAMPKEIVFRDELPRTLVGKVAYRLLEAEANEE